MSVAHVTHTLVQRSPFHKANNKKVPLSTTHISFFHSIVEIPDAMRYPQLRKIKSGDPNQPVQNCWKSTTNQLFCLLQLLSPSKSCVAIPLAFNSGVDLFLISLTNLCPAKVSNFRLKVLVYNNSTCFDITMYKI